MSILILSQVNQQKLAADTFACISAAKELNQPIHIVIADPSATLIAQQLATHSGIEKILCADNQDFSHGLAENVSQLILALADQYEYILAPANTFGKNILPRVAVQLNVAQISDVIKIDSPNVFTRPIYAGNAYLTLESHDWIKVMTIRPSAFRYQPDTQPACPITQLNTQHNDSRITFLQQKTCMTDLPNLTTAKVIIAGGRGLNSSDQFNNLLVPLAKKMGAAIGASRAAVDAGFMTNEYQIGQTGKIVAPDLYFAIGISGAIQHLAGMQASKVIVAINKDPNAKIFEVADYGLVADLNTVVPKLTELLE